MVPAERVDQDGAMLLLGKVASGFESDRNRLNGSNSYRKSQLKNRNDPFSLFMNLELERSRAKLM